MSWGVLIDRYSLSEKEYDTHNERIREMNALDRYSIGIQKERDKNGNDILFIEFFVQPVRNKLEEQNKDKQDDDVNKKTKVRGAGIAILDQVVCICQGRKIRNHLTDLRHCRNRDKDPGDKDEREPDKV